MTLPADTRLGPYQIIGPLGAGGMGEVYRARDTRLDREVAIKILPPQFSSDPLRKQRFEREAKAISSLNHPHICVLHDVGHQDGMDYLVMECVQGETLESRLQRGPLPLEQVLRLGIQMADALDRAHRKGVVHRDLKPGNIMLTPTGAKLLDFGLAKPMTPSSSIASLSAAATQMSPVTEQGTIVGTFQYMSPEQVEGKDADGRSDLFALGAVLYEMTTGRRAFAGKSQLSVASAILEKEPEPISAVKPMTPPALEHAIGRCLAKDPEERWQTGRDLAHELKWVAEIAARPGAQASGSRGGAGGAWTWPLAAALVVTTAAAAVLAFLYLGRAAPGEERVTRSYVKAMPGSSFILSDGSGFALSPDGRRLAYIASASDGKSILWVRPIDSLRAEPLDETSGATYPFWSPDGRFIGFFAGAKLKKVPASGGPPLALADASDGRGGSWNRQGDIIFTPGVNAPLFRVSDSGGNATPMTKLDPSQGELSHRWPQFLPDGRHFIFMAGSVFTPRENPTNTIQLGSLDANESEVLLHSHAGAVYASGRILYLRQGTLMAQPFDEANLKLTGDAVPVAHPVEEAFIYSKGLFSASGDGLLAYVEGGASAERKLLWYDRAGKSIGTVGGSDAYASPRLSPDGKRLLYFLDWTGYDIWSYDLTRGVKAPQTFSSAAGQAYLYGVWSPDGSKIAYSSFRLGKHAVCIKPSDGSSGEEVLVQETERYKFPTDWSPDGKYVVYQQGKEGGWDIWAAPVRGDRKPFLVHESPSSEREAVVSPDGKWMAYCSNESGEYKVYAAPFPGPGGKWQVSAGGGSSPRWRRDGREILYLSSDNKVMGVEVRANPSVLELSSPHELFETQPYGVFGKFDVTADGQRFIVARDAGQPATGITLVVNWLADLKR